MFPTLKVHGNDSNDATPGTPESRVSQCLAEIMTATAALDAIIDERPSAELSPYVGAVFTAFRICAGRLARWMPNHSAYHRDSEFGEVLVTIDAQLARAESLSGHARDEAYSSVEAFAAPYAVALYHEVVILESILTIQPRGCCAETANVE